MPIYFTSDPLGCVIQCGGPRDVAMVMVNGKLEKSRASQCGGIYLAVLATGARGNSKRPAVAAAMQPGAKRRPGQVFRNTVTERRVQLMHFDVERWRIRVIGEPGTVGSITEAVLARDYVLEPTETAYG